MDRLNSVRAISGDRVVAVKFGGRPNFAQKKPQADGTGARLEERLTSERMLEQVAGYQFA
jgi:hypothetical protein